MLSNKHKVRSRMVGAAVVALSVAATVGCTATTDTPTELVVAQATAPASLYPNVDKGNHNVRVSMNVVEQATRYKFNDGEYELVPLLAESWEQTTPTEWTVNVRENVKFSNGEDLTAQTFVDSLAAINSYPQGKLISSFAGWEMAAVDDSSLVITTPAPDAGVPGMLSQFYLVPSEYFKEVGTVDYGQNPIGTGPYLMTSFKQGLEVKLEANEDYWGDTATIKNVTVEGIADAASRVGKLTTGQAQLIADVPPELLDKVGGDEAIEVRSVPSSLSWFLLPNMNLPPFDDVRVRQAFNHAVDRESIVDGIFAGNAVVNTQWYSRWFIGFEDGYDPYPYDIEKSQELLAEAGYPEGIDVDFHFDIGSMPLAQQVAEAIQQQAQEAGFAVTLSPSQYPTGRSAFTTGEVPGIFMNNYAPPTLDMSSIYRYYVRSDASYARVSHSTEATNLLDSAALASTDADRFALYNDAQKQFLGEESIYGPLWDVVDNWGASKSLSFSPEPLQNYYFADMKFK